MRVWVNESVLVLRYPRAASSNSCSQRWWFWTRNRRQLSALWGGRYLLVACEVVEDEAIYYWGLSYWLVAQKNDLAFHRWVVLHLFKLYKHSESFAHLIYTHISYTKLWEILVKELFGMVNKERIGWCLWLYFKCMMENSSIFRVLSRCPRLGRINFQDLISLSWFVCSVTQPPSFWNRIATNHCVFCTLRSSWARRTPTIWAYYWQKLDRSRRSSRNSISWILRQKWAG